MPDTEGSTSPKISFDWSKGSKSFHSLILESVGHIQHILMFQSELKDRISCAMVFRGWSLRDHFPEMQKHIVFAKLENRLAIRSYCDVLWRTLRTLKQKVLLKQSLEYESKEQSDIKIMTAPEIYHMPPQRIPEENDFRRRVIQRLLQLFDVVLGKMVKRSCYGTMTNLGQRILLSDIFEVTISVYSSPTTDSRSYKQLNNVRSKTEAARLRAIQDFASGLRWRKIYFPGLSKSKR